MRYLSDPQIGAMVTVTYAGPWLGSGDSANPVTGELEPCGEYDATDLLAKLAGRSWGDLLKNVVLPEISRVTGDWGSRELLAFLKPVVDGRITFILVDHDSPIAFSEEVLPPREHRADTVHRIGGPDWMERLKDVTDAVRVKLAPGDTLVLRVADHYTPNQIREWMESLSTWFEATYGERHPVLIVPADAVSILELPEPDIDPERPQEARTRVGSTWVTGHIPEAQARIQAAALHQEQLAYAREGLKEAKTAAVEWWEHGERLDGPPESVAEAVR